MSRVAVSYSPQVGGSSVISLKKSFSTAGCTVYDADYRKMMDGISQEEFDTAYKSLDGRRKLFAHAKAAAAKLLDSVDCLALSGSAAMIDPDLFYQEREAIQDYDFSRTIVELALVHVATQRGMPIMGVCGGHQVIAVYGGGTIDGLNSHELDTQKFYNYDTVTLRANTMLRQIIENQFDSKNPLKQRFFGAHNQAVSRLGKGFVSTAVGSDGILIEATESEHGVPVITTQFHPEVSVHGIPGWERTYKELDEDSLKGSIRIFEFFAKAGETYKNKKGILKEIKEKSQPISEDSQKERACSTIQQELIDRVRIKKENIKGVNEKKRGQITPSKWGAVLSLWSELVKTCIILIRWIASYEVTSKKVKKLKQKEAKRENISPESIIESAARAIKEIHSASTLPESVQERHGTPAEIMIDEPSKIWQKKESPNSIIADEIDLESIHLTVSPR